MVITDGGQVGIGTASPTSPAGVAKFLEIEGSTAGIVLHDDGNDPYEIWASGGNLVFRYNNTGGENGMLLSSSGFLGIGTTSPSTKLDVRNNDGVGNGLHLIGDFSRAGGADAQLILGYFANGSAVTGPVVYAANSMPLLFSSGSVERMRINSSGEVQARRPRSNTAGEVGLGVQPTDTTAHYGWRIDQTSDNLNLDYVNTPLNIMSYSTTGNVGI